MRLGALLSFTDGNNPNAIVEQAKQLESEGYSSIWMAHAMGRGFMLSDPFVTLSAVAAVTRDIEIGTAILQLPLYNPTDIALKSWSLQNLSGGRFILGVGAGSTASDYQVHDVGFDDRFSLFDTKLKRLREIFHTGKVDEHNLSPWPSVQGGPPIFFGTWGKNVARAAGEFDGWIASGMHRNPDECAAALVGYRKQNGVRAIVSTISIGADVDHFELREKLRAFKEAGFDDAIVMFLPGAPTPAEIRLMID
ncbi:MAG: alkanesulfonate monooxygenase SsuD [Candidatus Azotimanducaceae bacterium]|jgi:alkanesulfonate monooxygenase SsuD/methylene tetrahydromethanopterin reductase-like flavin-dependent oxidoreductase (luciferase family)